MLLLRPVGFYDLPRAPQGERIRGNVVGDARSRTDVSSLPELHRRHQGRVAADEHAVLDHRRVFVHAVVVAGDGAGTDVDSLANFRVTQIGQMIRLRALAQTHFL